MTTEKEEWKPRYSDGGQNEEGQNRERRPYQSYNRSNYNNNQGGYDRDENNRGGYNRQGGSYDRQSSGYDRQGGGYNNNRQGGYNNDRQGGYNRQGGSYNRQSGGYNNNRQGGYNNDRQGGYNNNRQGGYNNDRQGGYGNNSYGNSSYTPRPQRSYDNQTGESVESNGIVKKRRPRVGDSSTPISRNTGYDRPQSGGYNNNRQGGYNNDRQGGGYNRQGGYDRQGGGYNNNRQGGYNNNRQGGYNNNRQGGYNNRDNNYNPDSKYSFQKQLKYREENFDPNEPIRLNKYLANAGICSRREADEFIQAGVVKVNDVVASELGTKVKRSDVVMFHDQPIKLEHKIYVLLNKPKNCVTTADDPQERLTVMDLVKNACQERIFPVGRLDRNTTGVLLLTNDGDLASKLTHPKFLKKKIYHVWLDKNVTIADMQKLAEGIELEDGEIHADAISYVTDESKDQVGIEIHSGRNRIVRRMFESLGYHVIKLDRVYFAGLTKKNLKRGQWRYLNEKEVSMLRMGAFE